MDMPAAFGQRKGRGAASNDSGRFEAEKRIAFDDGWSTADEEPMPLRTTLSIDATRFSASKRPLSLLAAPRPLRCPDPAGISIAA